MPPANEPPGEEPPVDDKTAPEKRSIKLGIAVDNDERETELGEQTPPIPPLGANDEAILLKIHALLQDHEDLHIAIEALAEKTGHETLNIARLKKKKLRLKDEILKLKNQLTPDIIA